MSPTDATARGWISQRFVDSYLLTKLFIKCFFHMVIIGIDPGEQTGIAIFRNLKLASLDTIKPEEIQDWLTVFHEREKIERVIYEDNRLTRFIFSAAKHNDKSPAYGRKIARNVGQNGAWGKVIDYTCGKLGIISHGISPKGKGEKISAEKLFELTGYAESSNQHKRDAAMVVLRSIRY